MVDGESANPPAVPVIAMGVALASEQPGHIHLEPLGRLAAWFCVICGTVQLLSFALSLIEIFGISDRSSWSFSRYYEAFGRHGVVIGGVLDCIGIGFSAGLIVAGFVRRNRPWARSLTLFSALGASLVDMAFGSFLMATISKSEMAWYTVDMAIEGGGQALVRILTPLGAGLLAWAISSTALLAAGGANLGLRRVWRVLGIFGGLYAAAQIAASVASAQSLWISFAAVGSRFYFGPGRSAEQILIGMSVATAAGASVMLLACLTCALNRPIRWILIAGPALLIISLASTLVYSVYILHAMTMPAGSSSVTVSVGINWLWLLPAAFQLMIVTVLPTMVMSVAWVGGKRHHA
jgi:hypothetical protein